jgi:DNA-binding transcriptional LysR family regulator
VQKDVWLMQTIVGLVAGGTGVALVPASLRNFRRKGVVYRTVRGLSPTVEMGMVWRRGDSSAVLRAFLDVVEEVDLLGEGERESEEQAVLRGAGTGT